ncbi:hypothetical protein MLD38_038799 [Melastoma candidum]|uniref:Uncharacterized protein n=1 Tax=Melastoma candidum TaxID=119954 RepID=A0ACB9L016_9MYRT|nr:hypothetical protein MLD38_038799 [Melastoma candidum]
MLEHSLEEKNLENAKASLEVLLADLQFLRDQVTISQLGCPPKQDSSTFWYSKRFMNEKLFTTVNWCLIHV